MNIKRITNKVKKGTIIIEVEGFFIERFINLCKIQNIDIMEIKYITAGLITFKASSNNFGKIKNIADKTKCRVKIKKKKGIYFVIFRYKKRRVFFYLFILLIALVILLSTYIFRIEITGNERISNEEILRVLKKADVYVGKNRLFVDERKAGNMLRTEIYDIAWVGVEVKGTKINIKVVEKTLLEDEENENLYGNIIASKSGVISKIIAENGTPRLLTGSYIEKGMVAIEGVIESELIGNINVHAKGILRVKNTYTYEAKEKYNIEEKKYTGKKIYGIGFGIKDKEYLLKYLPKDYIYDITKKEKKLRITGDSFKVIFAKYEEYELLNKNRSKEELVNICKDRYDKYISELKQDTSVISNEQIEVIDDIDGITYKVTYDLEEEVGVFQKTGE